MSERYDYYEAVKNDILDYIDEEINFTDFKNLEELNEHLNDVLWVDDSVTGNASGSYYCNAWRAEEAICHNWDLLEEALREFGEDGLNALERGAEYCDVTIRCFILSRCITAALEEIKEDFNKLHNKGGENN